MVAIIKLLIQLPLREQSTALFLKLQLSKKFKFKQLLLQLLLSVGILLIFILLLFVSECFIRKQLM